MALYTSVLTGIVLPRFRFCSIQVHLAKEDWIMDQSSLPYSRTLRQLGSIACAALLLAACSSGESGGGAASVAAPVTGTFVDSPVNGLHYTSVPSNPVGGMTTNGGQYQCVPSDTVTFDLGGRVIGTGQPCGELVTAVSVFGATSITDLRVRNLAQLLLTLGGIPADSQPIELPASIPPTLPAQLNFSDPHFEQMLQTSLSGRALVSQAQVAAHLSASFKTVTVTGVTSGTVTSIPTGLVCTGGTCSHDFVRGTRVVLAAIGTGFTGWNGDGCTGAGTCQILVTATQAVRAVFLAVPPPATLTILPNQGTGTGVVTCSANGGAFVPCATSYPNGTALVFRATANGGSIFGGWSEGTGNATSCTNTTVDCPINLTANSTVRANFIGGGTFLSVTAISATFNGGGGSILCSANGGEPNACGSYPVGATLVLTATPNSVSNFTGWNGAGCMGTGTCSFTLTAATTVIANFNRPTLSVTVAGTGLVTSSPAGINCGATCAASFAKGTTVTLTATGTNFSGWTGGGCIGVGSCVVTLTGDVIVSATFGNMSGTGRFHFFTRLGGPVLAVSATAPGATPITVTPVSTAAALVYSANWNSTSKQFTNLQSAFLVYANNGMLWRVNATASSGVPGSASNPPIQISSETGASTVCKLLVVDILPAPATARVAYTISGADGQCGTGADNVTKIVSVSDTAVTPPSVLPTGLVLPNDQRAVYNMTTGVATHIFVTDMLNNATAKIVDVSTKAVTSIQANVPGLTILAQDTSDRVFVRNDPARQPNVLYVYTISSNSLVPLVTGTVLGVLFDGGLVTSDGVNLYVADGGILHLIPLSATTQGDVGQLLNLSGVITGVLPTTNRVYVVESGGLTSVLKSGGTPRVDVDPASGDFVLLVSFSRNGLVYYTRMTLGPPPPGSSSPIAIASATAEILREDGSIAFSQSDAWFSQGIFEPSFGIRSESVSPSRVFLLTSPNMSFSGGTLSAIDAATGTQSVVMGAIPPTWNMQMLPSFPFFTFENLGSSALGFSSSGDPSNPNNNRNLIFFMDAAVPNSLVQIPVSGSFWFQVL